MRTLLIVEATNGFALGWKAAALDVAYVASNIDDAVEKARDLLERGTHKEPGGERVRCENCCEVILELDACHTADSVELCAECLADLIEDEKAEEKTE